MYICIHVYTYTYMYVYVYIHVQPRSRSPRQNQPPKFVTRWTRLEMTKVSPWCVQRTWHRCVYMNHDSTTSVPWHNSHLTCLEKREVIPWHAPRTWHRFGVFVWIMCRGTYNWLISHIWINYVCFAGLWIQQEKKMVWGTHRYICVLHKWNSQVTLWMSHVTRMNEWYPYIQIHICVSIIVYVYMYVCVYVCIHTCIHTYRYIHVYIYVHTCKYIHVHMHMYLYIISVIMCIYICIYI